MPPKGEYQSEFFLVSFVIHGTTAKISSATIEPARNIKGEGINSVVIASAPGFSSLIPIAALIALPTAGPISIGISTENTIRTP